MKRTNEDLYSEIERQIRDGRHDLAGKSLASLNVSRLPRKWRKPFAHLARRTGLLELGLRLLTPVVRPEEPGAAKPSDGELSEYAVLLLRIGVVAEAQAILAMVDPRQAPETLLYLAFCHFSQWEYAEALPFLEKYLRADISPYSRLVGSLNLADALISVDRHEEAEPLLRETLASAEGAGYTHLQGNCLEMLTQIALIRNDFNACARFLSRSLDLLPHAKSADQLHIQRWSSTIEAMKSQTIEPLLKFRNEALARHQYESVRVADFLRLRIEFSQREFEFLYFGTPFRMFRERLEKQVGPRPTTDHFLFGSNDGPSFDIARGRLNDAENDVAGSKIHAVLNFLLRDFYQPVPPAALFSLLFPTEHFNIQTSPNRVHQTLWRARQWLREHRLPAEITTTPRGLALVVSGPMAFRVPLDRAPIDRQNLALRELQVELGGRESFTLSEACHILRKSESATLRILNCAIEARYLEKFGASTATQYLFAGGDRR